MEHLQSESCLKSTPKFKFQDANYAVLNATIGAGMNVQMQRRTLWRQRRAFLSPARIVIAQTDRKPLVHGIPPRVSPLHTHPSEFGDNNTPGAFVAAR